IPAQLLLGGAGFPATYRVWFWMNPTVAPPGTGASAAATPFTRSNTCTLACCPPPSGPQLSTHACVPSLVKNAYTGRSNPCTTWQVGVVPPVGHVELCGPATMLNG